MANAKEQLVSARMLQQAGWLNTKPKVLTGGTTTWGMLTGNTKRLLTGYGLLHLPCKWFTKEADKTVTSVEGYAELKNHILKSDVTESDRLLRWEDFEEVGGSLPSTDDLSVLVTRIYVVSSFGFYGWKVSNLTKSSDGVCSADVQVVMTPPDGASTAAKQTYYWTHLRSFKTATSASTPTALGPVTFTGSFTKGSTGYMYSNTVNIKMYGVSDINSNILGNGSDAITQSCWYEETT